MVGEVHPKTLFHLVPANQVSHDALLHPDNKHCVSSSKYGPGLEVGYHVPSRPGGHVITRLGRDVDLILRESTRKHPISAVHVAFEINTITQLVLLSVRSKQISSVTFAVLKNSKTNESTGEESTGEESTGEDITGEDVTGEEITGDGVMLYGQNCEISIASYNFKLFWRTISKTENADSLKALTVQG